MFKVGIDVGGTFTDVFGLNDSTGEAFTAKHLTTPEDLSRGVLAAIEKASLRLSSVDQLVHGSTIAINTLIQRNYYGFWPKVALVTTSGFRDTMEIAKYQRPHMYDAYQEEIKPLIPRRFRFTIPEKIDAQGQVLRPLDEAGLKSLAARFKELGIESVAVVFLNSYLNPEHELKAKAILEIEMPGLPVITSVETSPKLRELGRVITTSVRAILVLVIEKYLTNLEKALRDKGFKGRLLVVRSDGGIATAEMMKRSPEAMLFSGPAAGVYSGLSLGRIKGEKNLLTQDTGGTSYDVCLIEDGQILQTSEYELDVDMPLITPLLDVRSIGTGGGSIAWVDAGGGFRVGPQSAGSKPGPACYGFGGQEPTVTDANLVLGRIDATLGGKLRLRHDLALEAIKTKIAAPLGLEPIEAADGIIRISCSDMARAISLVTTDRGRDPRHFVPVVFGGAGPMMICFVADLLEIPRAIVPAAAGVCSAEGAIMMPLKTYLEQTFFTETANLDLDQLNFILDDLAGRVRQALMDQGAEPEVISFRRIAEMRYLGQSYEVMVDIPQGRLDRDKINELIERFHQAHQKEYFVCNRDFATAILNLRVEGTALVGEVSHPTYQQVSFGVDQALKSSREVYFEGGFKKTPVYDYEKLMPGHTIAGPAIVEMKHSCLVLAPKWQMSLDEYRNLMLKRVD